ncbi:hypothetical protein GCM10020216_008940 [Nonomuraea helvata]
MTDNPLPTPRRSPDSEPPLPAWMTLPGSLVQPSAPAVEDGEVSEDGVSPPSDEAGEDDSSPSDETPDDSSPSDETPEDDVPSPSDETSEDDVPSVHAPSDAVLLPSDETPAPPTAALADAAPPTADDGAPGGARVAGAPDGDEVATQAGAAEVAGQADAGGVAGHVGAAPGADPSDAGSAGRGVAKPAATRAFDERGHPEAVEGTAQGGSEPDSDREGGEEGSGQEGGGPTLEAALEAILLVVDEPVAEVTLAQVLERPTHEVAAALRRLSAEYTAAGRGFDLREVAGGWRFYTRADCAPLVERFVRDGQQTRLTQAALETLAVVAYRQPVSRARVAAVRGVNSDGVMRTLVARGLVEEAGTDPESQAMLYRTSSYFLERLGLRDLSELPELAPFLPDDVENLEETTK